VLFFCRGGQLTNGTRARLVTVDIREYSFSTRYNALYAAREDPGFQINAGVRSEASFAEERVKNEQKRGGSLQANTGAPETPTALVHGKTDTARNRALLCT
jgi:hypothetical protein